MPAVTVSITLNSPAAAIVPGIGSAAGRWGVLMGYLTRDSAGIVRWPLGATRSSPADMPWSSCPTEGPTSTIAAPERPGAARLHPGRSGLIAPDRDGPLG